MFARLVAESFRRNPRRKVLSAAALVVGMAVATATLTVALEVGDRLAREFRELGANLVVTPQSDTLPVEIGGVDYRPVDEGAYLREADLGRLKMIFWRHNILGFTPFLDVPAIISSGQKVRTTMIGTWYEHLVSVPDGTTFKTGLAVTNPGWKIQGRWFKDSANEAVVGAALGAAHPVDLAIGRKIEIMQNESAVSPLTLEITGIVSTGGSEDHAVLVPLSVAQNFSGHAGQFRQLFVSALTKPADALSERNPDTMTPAERDRWYCSPYITSIGSQIRAVLPDTEVRAIRRVADTEGRILTRVSTLLWIVTIAALLAAGLAVGATSAATVLDRRSEIGVMKALGAANSLVASIFVAEQVLLAIAGGLIGFFAGLILARALGSSVFGSPAAPRLILLPVILALATMVAIVGSLVPLHRASRFQPAPILRGE